jgi:hypothetical protein
VPLKFQNPKWRFKSPGPIPDKVLNSFYALVKTIAEQGDQKDVFEDFKSRFSGVDWRSSNTDFARQDLYRDMSNAAANAPKFIGTFVAGCEAWERSGLDTPDIDIINETLAEGGAGYQIIGDTLVATTESVSQILADDEPVQSHNMNRVSSKPQAKNGLKVFLCHSSVDKARAKQLYDDLETDGFSPWLDKEELIGGQDFDLEIKKAIRTSHVVVICLSKIAVTRPGYVHKEIKTALDIADEQPEGTIFIIPVRLDDCTVPTSMKHIHYIDLFASDGYNKLVKALRTRLASLR